MFPHPLEIEGLLVKVEAAYGVDAVPVAGSDGVRGVGRLWNGITPEWAFPNLNEDVVSNSLVQAAPGAPAGRIVSIEYACQLRGAGAAYSSVTPVRPEVDPILIAGGMSRTHVDTGSSESVTYALADSGHGSATVYAYAGAKLFRVTGCRGVWTWSPNAGELGMLTFRLQGMLATAPTEIEPPAITYDAAATAAAVGMGLAIVPNGSSSWTPRTKNMEITPGHNIVRLDDVNAADGIEGFFLRGRSEPRFSMTPRTADLADYDAYAHAASRIDHTIDLTLNPTVQYNRVKLDVNSAYLLSDPAAAEDNGFAAWRQEFLCRDLALIFD